MNLEGKIDRDIRVVRKAGFENRAAISVLNRVVIADFSLNSLRSSSMISMPTKAADSSCLPSRVLVLSGCV